MNEKTCRKIVKERSGGHCELTGRRDGCMSYHHRLKKSQGGAWTPENVVLVNGTGTVGAHGWIEANPKAAAEIGFHVRPWEKSAEKPILLHGKYWVKLHDTKPEYTWNVDEGEK